MKRKTIFSFAAILALASPSAWALVGGPWDHLRGDQFSQSNSDGIYQASVSMKNGSGFVRFASRSDMVELTPERLTTDQLNSGGGGPSASINSTNLLASSSNTVIFFEGKSYFANTYGYVDAASGGVNGTSNGVSALVESITQSLTSASSQSNALIDISGLSESMSMAFTGRVFEKRPQIRFSASGEVSFFSRPPLQVAAAGQIVILRVAAGGSTTSTTTTTTTTTTNSSFDPTDPLDTGTGTDTTTTVTNTTTQTDPTQITSSSFPVDATVKVTLIGSRINTQLPPASNPFSLLSGGASN